MKIKMELLSDAIFGNGLSIPGEEDISVLTDRYGFPYYKGGTLKGIFREELERYLEWTGEPAEIIDELLGKAGRGEASAGSMTFSDLMLSDNVIRTVLNEIGSEDQKTITNCMTNMRTFTQVENGTVKDGSLRVARCVNKGLCFYGTINCPAEHEDMAAEVLALIRYIGTMRNRGFGKVRISVIG